MPLKGESYRYFSGDGTWCWFSDPRAIYYEGKHKRTYAGWVDSLGNIIIGFYDHDTKNIENKILHKNLEVDDHDNPSLFIDDNGKVLVFYSKHAQQEPLFLARAKNAEEISEWEATEQLSLNDTIAYQGLSNTYTYANVCQLSEKKINYIFSGEEQILNQIFLHLMIMEKHGITEKFSFFLTEFIKTEGLIIKSRQTTKMSYILLLQMDIRGTRKQILFTTQSTAMEFYPRLMERK